MEISYKKLILNTFVPLGLALGPASSFAGVAKNRCEEQIKYYEHFSRAELQKRDCKKFSDERRNDTKIEALFTDCNLESRNKYQRVEVTYEKIDSDSDATFGAHERCFVAVTYLDNGIANKYKVVTETVREFGEKATTEKASNDSSGYFFSISADGGSQLSCSETKTGKNCVTENSPSKDKVDYPDAATLNEIRKGGDISQHIKPQDGTPRTPATSP